MYKQSNRRFWDQDQGGHKVKEHVDQLPHGKLSEKATLTLEQFVAELKKRIQDKEKQKNNQSLPRKNPRLPKPKNTDGRQKIIPKQVQQKSTSSAPKTSSLKKTQKKTISVKQKDLKNNNSKQKAGIKDIKQSSPKSTVSSVHKSNKKPKFNIPKEGFQ